MASGVTLEEAKNRLFFLKGEIMTLYEFSIIAAVMIVLATLRFGVPALIMWLLTVVSHHFVHVA